MIKTEDIQKIINDGAIEMLTITVKDISYAILAKEYGDDYLAYKSVFGESDSDAKIKKYSKSRVSAFVKEKIKGLNSEIIEEDMLEELTFEQNKMEMIRLISRVNKAVDEDKMDEEKAVKLLANIRERLNKSFNVEQEQSKQYIIVEPKYNFICPHTRHECYVYTKEDLMKKYNLKESDEK